MATRLLRPYDGVRPYVGLTILDPDCENIHSLLAVPPKSTVSPTHD
eukprot:SAG31_NODE_2220_length_6157_cov_4.078244_4_plen_46_part_00